MNEFIVADNGTAQAALCFEGFRSDEIELELGDLLQYVRRSCGATLPLGGTTYAVDCRPWRIRRTPGLDLANGGFRVAASPDSLEFEAGDLEGIGNAIYWFLEQFAGVRWFWPGRSGEVVSERATIAVPVGSCREEPDYVWRRIGVGGPFWAPYSYNLAERMHLDLSDQYQADWEQWYRRNRFGGPRIADGHRSGEFLPPARYGEAHPEYFALVNGGRLCDWRTFNGKHSCQPCTSHPDVIRITADYILEQFRADPGLAGFSIALNDGSGFCECTECRRLDMAPAEAVGADGDDTYLQTQEMGEVSKAQQITDRIFRFANAVAELVAVEEPDKLILMLVYSSYRNPPRHTRLHRNVLAQFCTATNKYVVPEIEAQEVAILDAMTRSAPLIAIYDYMEQGAWPGPPRLYPEKLAETLRAFRERGVCYYATQPGKGFATSGLNFYLLGRCLWNTETSPASVLDDFYQTSFGDAAPPMQRYFEAFMARWRDFHAAPGALEHDVYTTLALLYDDAFLRARRGDLAQAKQLTRNAEVQERIDFFAQGLHFTLLTVDAAGTAGKLREAGLETVRWDPAMAATAWQQCDDKERAAHTIREAAATWDRLLTWVTENAGQYIFPEFYFAYCYGRTFKQLHEYVDGLSQQL